MVSSTEANAGADEIEDREVKRGVVGPLLLLIMIFSEVKAGNGNGPSML